MTTTLNQYFCQYADNALKTVRDCAMAKNFYSGVAKRLNQGHDFSDELPAVKKIGLEGTKDVANQALKDFAEKNNKAWDLPKSLAEQCKSKVTWSVDPEEIYPRYSVTHSFLTPAGNVKVLITTKGQNFSVDIITSKNKMAANAAMVELEKIISFALLLS